MVHQQQRAEARHRAQRKLEHVEQRAELDQTRQELSCRSWKSRRAVVKVYGTSITAKNKANCQYRLLTNMSIDGACAQQLTRGLEWAAGLLRAGGRLVRQRLHLRQRRELDRAAVPRPIDGAHCACRSG